MIAHQRLRACFGGKLIVITGGISGIGLAVAERLATVGARLVLVANNADRLEAAANALRATGASVATVVCDLAHRGQTRAAIRTLVEVHGTPDVLINNAGFAVYRTFEQSSPDEVDDLLEVNFAAHLRCTRLLLDGMIARRRGHIVNVASIAGLMTITPNAVYSAAKFGIVAWSRALRIELARFGVQVSTVCPGRVETPFFDHETFRQRAHRRETELTIAMPRVVDAILSAAMHNRELVVVPAYLGWMARLVTCLPPVRLAYNALIRRRVEDLY